MAKNRCVLTVRDVDLEEGKVDLKVSYDTPPQVKVGPCTPAEEVMALVLTYLHRYVLEQGVPYRPKRAPYPNRCVLIIEDAAGVSDLRIQASYDTQPDIPHGPQTPAEGVMASAQTFLLRHVIREHRVGAVLTPDEWAPDHIGGG